LPLLFDIGANRGDATLAGIQQGYKVIAVEPSRIYADLVKNFIYSLDVVPLKYAVSDKDYERVEFYEAEEDGLSTLNPDWLTSETMPYNGKPFTVTQVTTITIDTLVKKYDKPDLIKIDVEGAEWSVFRGMTQKYGRLTFEWTEATLDEHEKQLEYLAGLGYTEIGPQFIVNHLEEPETWYSVSASLKEWRETHKADWENGGWEVANLRPTADVGMVWVR
jgi:FkbM family methyltransferase